MSLDVSVNTVNSGVAINKTLYSEIYGVINASVKEPTESDVTIAIANLAGYRSPILPDQLAVDITVRHLTEKYKEPLTTATHSIKDILVTGTISNSIKNIKK